ncbi:hypothetical protein GCM10009557_96490 [Virgisporangium ochraceum]
MRWLVLYLRSRGVPVALVVAAGAVALVWAGWSALSDSHTVNERGVTLTVMFGVAAFTRTLSGPDDALDHTAAVRWPVRRLVHVLAVGGVIVALLLPSLATDARFEPVGLVLRNTAGLLGLTALGTALFGAAVSWVAPVTWSVASVLPFLEESPKVGIQIAGWLVQPADTGVATGCAVILAVAGLVAYSWRGAPRNQKAETAPAS